MASTYSMSNHMNRNNRAEPAMAIAQFNPSDQTVANRHASMNEENNNAHRR